MRGNGKNRQRHIHISFDNFKNKNPAKSVHKRLKQSKISKHFLGRKENLERLRSEGILQRCFSKYIKRNSLKRDILLQLLNFKRIVGSLV
jgi:hypothetical protein